MVGGKRKRVLSKYNDNKSSFKSLGKEYFDSPLYSLFILFKSLTFAVSAWNNCKIKTVEAKAFRKLTSLVELDLGENLIQVIEKIELIQDIGRKDK